MDEVSLEALTKGIAEIVNELLRRGYKQEVILELTRAQQEKHANISV